MDRHVCLFQADNARYKLPPTNIDPAMSWELEDCRNWAGRFSGSLFVWGLVLMENKTQTKCQENYSMPRDLLRTCEFHCYRLA